MRQATVVLLTLISSLFLQIEREIVKSEREHNGFGQNSSLREGLSKLKMVSSESAKIAAEIRSWPSPVFDCAQSKFTAMITYLDDEGQIYLQTEEQVWTS